MDCPKCDFSGTDEEVISHHTRKHKGGERFYCEDCKNTPHFKGEKAYFQHRQSVHGDSLSDMPKSIIEGMDGRKEYKCKNCGQNFKRYSTESGGEKPQFCSNVCWWDSGGPWSVLEPTAERIEFNCENCGNKFSRRKSQTVGETHNVRFCSQGCQNKFMSGKLHPNYIDGESRYYGPTWPKQRRKARKRDFYQCRLCRISDGKCREKYGCGLHVHHRTPFRYFEDSKKANRLCNLLTVCPRCHGKIEQELSTQGDNE